MNIRHSRVPELNEKIMMEPREQSESMNNLEKDQILSTEAQNEPQEVVSEEVKVEEPVAEEPKAEEPVAEEPKAEEPVAEEAKNDEPAAEEAAPKLDLAGKTKSELVDLMRAAAARPIEEVKDEVQAIKAAFFALRREETAQEKEAFLANGNEESDFTPKEDADENNLKELLNVLKERRTEYNAAQEANREANLEKKRQIITLINEIANRHRHLERVPARHRAFL